MVESDRVFVDSNYFIALFNPSDMLHTRACDFARKIDSYNTFLVISNFVFLEIVTVLSQRRGRRVSIEVGEHLLTNSLIVITHVDELLQRESWHIFQNSTEKNMSFVDASIVAIMKAEDITKLLTFDIHDFKKLQKQYHFSFYEI